MSTRLRERLASVGVGRMSTVSASILPGATATVDIPVPQGFDIAVATSVAFGGVSQVGPVVWDLNNGLQDYSGYANTSGDPVDVFVPFGGTARLTVFNGLVGTISYNVTLIAMTTEQYNQYIRGKF